MPADKAYYQAVLEDLQAQRDRLDQAIAVIRQQLGGDAPAAPVASSRPALEITPAEIAVAVPRTAFTGLTMPDAIKAYLRSANVRQTPRQIATGLRKGGFHSAGKNVYGHVYTTLLRLEKTREVAKIDNEWGLVEWYPSLRREKRVDKMIDQVASGTKTAEQVVDDAVNDDE